MTAPRVLQLICMTLAVRIFSPSISVGTTHLSFFSKLFLSCNTTSQKELNSKKMNGLIKKLPKVVKRAIQKNRTGKLRVSSVVNLPLDVIKTANIAILETIFYPNCRWFDFFFFLIGNSGWGGRGREGESSIKFCSNKNFPSYHKNYLSIKPQVKFPWKV